MSESTAEERGKRLDLVAGDWDFAGVGHFEGWVDRRALLVVRHGWEASQRDGYGALSRQVEVPAHWQGPVRLHFYMSDDYDGSQEQLETDSWLGQINLPGHRFKQVLIDQEVVWERDVADAEGGEQQNRFAVELPGHIGPGDRFGLTFRLVDRLGSQERLAGDFRHIGSTEDIEAESPWKFATHLYVGDVVLAPAAMAAPAPGVPPGMAAVQVEKRSVGDDGQAVDFPVALVWEGWEQGVTGIIRCGIPLPPGRVQRVDQVVLRRANGRPLALQIAPMNYWPDGSLRWVEVDAVAPDEGEQQLWLDVADEGPAIAPEQPASVQVEANGGWGLNSGAVAVQVGGAGGELTVAIIQGAARLEQIQGLLEVGEQVFRPLVETGHILARGPVRAEIELCGQLVAGADSLGRFVARLAVFAGQPYARLTWRIFNDRPQTLEIERFELVGQSPLGETAQTHWGGDRVGGGTVRLHQIEAERYVVRGPGEQMVQEGTALPGWLAASDSQQTAMVLVRHFRPQFPKALELDRGRWRIALFAGTDGQPQYRPSEGEAKRHEIWLGLWPQQLEPDRLQQVALAWDRPGRLFDAAYFSASGGLGPAAFHSADQFPQYHRLVQTQYGELEDSRFHAYGLRHWGDLPYNRGLQQWRNGYYDVQQGLASAYLMSGESRWFDHLEAAVRHIIDIDICHASQAHPEWVGSIHGYDGADHTGNGPWPPTQRNRGTLAYWRLTGDIDARDAALAVAESALRTGRGLGATSVRNHAGMLYCLTAAYDETGEARFLQGAQRLVEDALGRIDRRRGCYAEVHGNLSYRGNVPWMVAQLAEPLYYYCRESGSQEGARALVGLVESILTENTTRGVPGDVHGYSHNPHYAKNGGYHALIAPAVFYAYELTGDAFYLQHGRAMFAQMMRDGQIENVLNCAWNTPALLYFLQRYGAGN
ncbi:MAG: hypothetical protein GKR89_04820 [Candidatus Latescibacteria bacterium]|nr:hypothetical protein [Candidatus Latescibacterota bacterium]